MYNFFILFFIPIVDNSVLFKLFLHFSVSCVFALLHSSIACNKLFGINVGEKEYIL